MTERFQNDEWLQNVHVPGQLWVKCWTGTVHVTSQNTLFTCWDKKCVTLLHHTLVTFVHLIPKKLLALGNRRAPCFILRQVLIGGLYQVENLFPLKIKSITSQYVVFSLIFTYVFVRWIHTLLVIFLCQVPWLHACYKAIPVCLLNSLWYIMQNATKGAGPHHDGQGHQNIPRWTAAESELWHNYILSWTDPLRITNSISVNWMHWFVPTSYYALICTYKLLYINN